MGDPLSVLGAAVGVTSLIIQLTDECVKGLEFSEFLDGLTNVLQAINSSTKQSICRKRIVTFSYAFTSSSSVFSILH